MHELILMLKYEKYEALGFRIGAALAGIFPRPDLDVLVPVPLHLNSKRHYNQAEALARGLGDAWGIEVADAARWTVDVPSRAVARAAARRRTFLEQTTDGPPRAAAYRRERPVLLKDAFALDGVTGLRVGLVDDVCTAGMTLSRLGEAAEKNGAEVAGAFVAASCPPTR
jgi:predicted amidophosphoribosyltransferase